MEYAVLQLFLLAIRIFITIYCVKRAGELNRNKGGWGIFGFFLPILAIIWIQFMKPKRLWDSEPANN